ncbi:MAG TPA: hemolysin family protein [Phycisphaerae bacterium]|nr:hemolysin family protein [Phycisphaerae bacterium]
MPPLIWVVVCGATALSGFFALTSYSLRVARRVALEEAFSGPAHKERLDLLEKHLPALRLTTSFLRALANLALTVAILQAFDVRGGGPAVMAGALVLIGGLITVFGIVIPQAWASYAGEKVLRATLGILLACRYALYPVVAVMAAFDLPIRRLSGVADRPDDNGEGAAKAEILQAASDGAAEGAVDAEEVEMIESVMEFGDTHAGEIMTPRTDIFAVPIETPWQEACARIVEAGHTRVPVYEGDIDTIVGVLYAKDLLQLVAQNDEVPLQKIMRTPYFVPETKPLDDLLREFKRRKVHIAVVLDEYGGTAGIATIEDLLEEIVGDISDEYDADEPEEMKHLNDRTVEIDARMRIDDLNDALQLELPEDEDYDTVAGFVFAELGYIPKVGEKLESRRARFNVLAADERKIVRLRVERLQEAGKEE